MQDKQLPNIVCGIKFSSHMKLGLHGYDHEDVSVDDPLMMASVGKTYTNRGYLSRAKVGGKIRGVKSNATLDMVLGIEPSTIPKEGIEDEETTQLRLFLKLLHTLLKTIKGRIVIYHDDGLIERGLRNRGSNRIKKNVDLWHQIYKTVGDNDRLDITFWNNNHKEDMKESQALTVGRFSLIARANHIANLTMDTVDVCERYISDSGKSYWVSNAFPPEGILFKNVIYITDDECKEGIYYCVSPHKEALNIGKKSVHCGYGVAFTKEDKGVLPTMKTLTDAYIDKGKFVTWNIRNVRVSPGTVINDLQRFGKQCLHHIPEKLQYASIHGNVIFDYACTWGTRITAHDICHMLHEVGESHFADTYVSRFVKDVTSRDITTNFIDTDALEKGKRLPNQKLKDAKLYLSVSQLTGHQRAAIFTTEIPDKNTVIKLTKMKNFKAEVLRYTTIHDNIIRTAYLFTTDTFKFICCNWVYSVVMVDTNSKEK